MGNDRLSCFGMRRELRRKTRCLHWGNFVAARLDIFNVHCCWSLRRERLIGTEMRWRSVWLALSPLTEPDSVYSQYIPVSFSTAKSSLIRSHYSPTIKIPPSSTNQNQPYPSPIMWLKPAMWTAPWVCFLLVHLRPCLNPWDGLLATCWNGLLGLALFDMSWLRLRTR